MKPNQSVETNRRPASPLNVGRQSESASCAPAFLPAAVAHLCRSPTTIASMLACDFTETEIHNKRKENTYGK